MAPRFYCTDFSADAAVLEGDELHHLRSVRRLVPGDEVELFDGAGRVARCRIAAVGKRAAELDVMEVREIAPPVVRLTVATAIPKAARMDMLVEKITELGSMALWPLLTERSDVTAAGRAKRDKWRRRAVEAAKQCGRAHLPQIIDPLSFDDALNRAVASPPDVLLVADPSPQAQTAVDVVGASRRIGTVPSGSLTILGFIGPEGGFSDEELTRLKGAGAVPVRLGPHILRIETAAIALAAAVAAGS